MHNRKFVWLALAAGLFFLGSLMRSPQTEAKGAVYSSPVTVMNANAQPVPNRDQDNPPQQPFQFTVNTTVPASGILFNLPLFTVPAGKRAVIECVSAYGNTAPAPGGLIQIVTTTGGTTGFFNTLMQAAG